MVPKAGVPYAPYHKGVVIVFKFKNFNLHEFECPCCHTLPKFYEWNVVQLVFVLEQIREDIGVPIIINSSYRCSTHNADVGGVADSQHLTASAADITADNVSPSLLAVLAYRYGIRYIGIGTDFVHLDLRHFGDKNHLGAIWSY